MQTENSDAFGAAADGLEDLRRFAGSAADFWRRYMEILRQLTGAAVVVIARRRGEEGGAWGRVAALPAGAPSDAALREFWIRVESLCNGAAESKTAEIEWAAPATRRTDRAAAVRLEADRDAEVWVAVLLLPESTVQTATEALRRLRLAAYVPAHFQLRRVALHLQSGEGGAVSVLELMTLLNRTRRFIEAGMTLCNELASRHRCDRVSLGWERQGYVVVRAVSHTDQFVRKLEAVQALEAAMEECFDQEDALVWPPLPGEDQITRDHAKFAGGQGAGHLCSVPLRIGGRPGGVLLCERQKDPFEEDEVRDLLMAADLVAPRLQELERMDRWFGARWAASAREGLAKLLGPRNTWAKVTAALVAIGLGVLFFGRTTQRIEAPFSLRAEKVNFVIAPFNGFIREVMAEPGTSFGAGDTLLMLDTRDLLLEEAAVLADQDRFSREAEKAQADNALAEMRIAEAQAAQARIRLEMVRHRLQRARLEAPEAGYVVEGDLRQRVGAPVRQGDVLFRVSSLDSSYVEARVSERDVGEITIGATGEIAFASQPKLKFPVRVTLVEPVAVSDETGNVFVVRCALESDPVEWWRPGMSGVAKINGERHTFFWIFFRRTVDFFRLLLWW